MGRPWCQGQAGWCYEIVSGLSCVQLPALTDFSAFEILRYPGVTTNSLQHIFPEISDIHPLLRARVDIQGRS